MIWEIAKQQICQKIQIGTNINSPNSRYRFVKKINYPIYSTQYGYNGEKGYLVTIGRAQSSYLAIPWSMLETCYQLAQSIEGYSGSGFRMLYPKQAKIHPCHVHVVGRMLAVAGVVKFVDGVYRATLLL